MSTVLITFQGIITVLYVRILPVCLYDICVMGSFSLYGSLLFYSYDIHVVDYDSYHCLFNMIYVLWLAMFSNLCRVGGGGLYCTIYGAIIHFIINVHDPDLILLVYMLSFAGRLATLK